MKRIANVIYELDFKVRDAECDIQGIVNNSNYQRFYEHCRHEFLIENGVSFSGMHDRGIDFVVARVEIQYKTPLKPLDEFKVTLAMKQDGVKVTFYQQVIRKDGKICNIAQTECVAIVNGKLGFCDEMTELLKKYNCEIV